MNPAESDDDLIEDTDTDAIALLTADHEDVRQLFAEYEDLVADQADEQDRRALALQICDALTAHATVEEEIFYPAARAALGDDDMLDEAEAEHASAKALIAEIQALDPSDDAFDDKVRLLAETVEHHVLEEEGDLFPQLQETEMDLQGLGEQIATRKEEVLAELAEADE